MAWVFCDHFYINISLARKWFTLAQLIIVQTFMSGIASSVADPHYFLRIRIQAKISIEIQVRIGSESGSMNLVSNSEQNTSKRGFLTYLFFKKKNFGTWTVLAFLKNWEYFYH
jgi:hypothetical protein